MTTGKIKKNIKVLLWVFTSVFILSNSSKLRGNELKKITNPDNGNEYLLTDKMSWESAQKLAKIMGGNLVTINDENENQWLVDNLMTSDIDFVWIGINDVENEGNFTWISGEKSNYVNWAKGEPNNNLAQGGEHFGVLNGFKNPFKRPLGSWSDAPKNAQLRGIIEITN